MGDESPRTERRSGVDRRRAERRRGDRFAADAWRFSGGENRRLGIDRRCGVDRRLTRPNKPRD